MGSLMPARQGEASLARFPASSASCRWLQDARAAHKGGTHHDCINSHSDMEIAWPNAGLEVCGCHTLGVFSRRPFRWSVGVERHVARGRVR